MGDAGQLWVDYQTGDLLLRHGRDEARESWPGHAPTLPGVLAAWRDAILDTAPVPVTMVDGLRTLEIVAACYASARDEAPVAVSGIGSG